MGYLGSKSASGAYQAIIASMPQHDTYIETHLGSGAIMLHKPESSRSIGIDLDQEAIERFTTSRSVELYCEDAVTFLNSFDFSTSGRTFIYSDPPYLLSTRTSRNRYTFEYTEADHRSLISSLTELKARGIDVILSGYPSKLYDELLKDWHTFSFQVMPRGGVRTERLWMSDKFKNNHWAKYAGSNFTDRQRISRKAKRWADKYESLPNEERLAILSALLKCEAADPT